MTGNSKIVQWVNDICNYLWLSATSIDFYKDLHRNHTGWGVWRFFVIYFIVAIMVTLYTFGVIYKGENQLRQDVSVANQQIPEVSYDGKNIATSAQTPIIIEDVNKNTVAAFDPSENLNAIHDQLQNKQHTPSIVLFGRNAIELYDYNANQAKTLISYELLFGHSPLVIASNNASYYCSLIFNKINKLLDSIAICTIALCFLGMLFVNIFNAILIKFFRFFITPTTFKTAYRMSLASICPTMVLRFLLDLVAPDQYSKFLTNCLSIVIFIIIIRALKAIKRDIRNSEA